MRQLVKTAIKQTLEDTVNANDMYNWSKRTARTKVASQDNQKESINQKTDNKVFDNRNINYYDKDSFLEKNQFDDSYLDEENKSVLNKKRGYLTKQDSYEMQGQASEGGKHAFQGENLSFMEEQVTVERLQEAIIWSEILGEPMCKRRKSR